MASLREDDLKQNAVVELSNDKSIAFSHEEIKSAMAWYYSLYGSGLEKHPRSCSIAERTEPHRDGLICQFVPGRNNCKSAAIYEELMVLDDLRNRGYMIYLNGETKTLQELELLWVFLTKIITTWPNMAR